MKRKHSKYILTLLATLICTVVFAQPDSLRKEVEVVKAYKPSVSDAYKINNIPKIEEARHQKPTFDYSIFSQPVFSTFSVNTLQAAKITGKPSEDTGFGLLRLGAGNYSKPYIDFFFNNNKSKNTVFGLHFKHLSSHGKVKLEGGDKVKAPFSDNSAEMFVKRYFRKSALKAGLSFYRNAFNYYGYPEQPVPSVLLAGNQSVNLFNTKQAFSKGALNISLVNTSKSKNRPTFGFDLKYHYFSTKSGQTEHLGDFAFHITKPVNNMTGILDAGGSFYLADNIINRATLLTGQRQQMWMYAKPAIFMENDFANFKAGGNIYFVLDKEDEAVLKFTPNVILNITPVEGILSIFGGVDGKYEMNNYSKIAYLNPFVTPGHDVKNSFQQFRFFGGFDGKFSTKTNFKIAAEYTMVKGQPFFYLEEKAPTPLSSTNLVVYNDFKILYDNMNLLKFNVEVFHAATGNFNLLLTGNYYVYEPETEVEAWNMPEFDAKLSLEYKVTEQLEVSSDIYLIGKRTGLIIYSPSRITGSATPLKKAMTLDTVFDLNVSGTYHF
ncbi:hypothetical protein MNBD_BACTEROID01-1251, partial [hydrothermal vent metagenome]